MPLTRLKTREISSCGVCFGDFLNIQFYDYIVCVFCKLSVGIFNSLRNVGAVMGRAVLRFDLCYLLKACKYFAPLGAANLIFVCF